MATTKIFPITATVGSAIAYIAAAAKTDNGRLISTFMCSREPSKAAKEFAEVTATGTGRSTVIAQHFIMSFKPGEVTPERAMEIGKEMCEKYLKDQYQYYLAVHTDKGHVHLHCIFNNTNLINGLTFETLENRRFTEKDRSYNKLRTLADEVCRRHHLSVVEHPEMGKGKSHWEWDMNRQGLSWKAKLKFTIDQVIKVSENFEDFLAKCADFGVLVEYNPDHKINLKFMLAEQRERNPRAKFTRSRTLGWYYETEQIKGRIAQYMGGMMYVPRIKVRQITPKAEENKFVRDAIDRSNMKVASIAKNIITAYGVEPDQVRGAAMAAFIERAHLVGELNDLNAQIKDLQEKLKVLKKYRKVKHIGEELKALSGREEKKYRKEHGGDIAEYHETCKQVLELYPSGNIPKVENLEKHIASLQKKLSKKNTEYNQADKKSRELSEATRTIEEYLRQEQSRDQQKRKKRNDLE